jgi:4-carboxymuconolactone decarboxylase
MKCPGESIGMNDNYGNRHQRGLDVLRTILNLPADDLDRTASAMIAAMGPILSSCVDHAYGDIWSRPQLCRRDRSLVTVTALTCIGGAHAELKTHLSGALNHGATPDELEELMFHLCGYAGYPRGIDGMRTLLMLFSERADIKQTQPRTAAEPKDDQQRICDGAEVIKGILDWSGSADDVAAMMEKELGSLGHFGLKHIMGEIWSRPQLSRRDRSLITVSALIALGKLPELRIHIPAALRHGMSRTEIDELMLHLTLYLGYPAAVEAKKLSLDIFATTDK